MMPSFPIEYSSEMTGGDRFSIHGIGDDFRHLSDEMGGHLMPKEIKVDPPITGSTNPA